MARPLRIEYPGAIYHVMSRGNARQAIFRDDVDRQKLLKDLEDTIVRCGWQAEMGGAHPAAAYRRFVEEGLKIPPPENPLAKAAHGWLLGGKEFVDRIRQEMKSPRFADEVPPGRSLKSVDVESVFAAVIQHYDVETEMLSKRGDSHIARAIAAYLARRLTSATLRELSVPLGLGRPESVTI